MPRKPKTLADVLAAALEGVKAGTIDVGSEPRDVTAALRSITVLQGFAQTKRDGLLSERAAQPGATLRSLAQDFDITYGRVRQLCDKLEVKPAGRVLDPARENLRANDAAYRARKAAA